MNTDPHIDYNFNPSDQLLLNAWPGPDKQSASKLREFLRTVAAADPKNRTSVALGSVGPTMIVLVVVGVIGAAIMSALGLNF